MRDRGWLATVVLVALQWLGASAPGGAAPLERLRHPDLDVLERVVAIDGIPASARALAEDAEADLAALGVAREAAHLDLRSGGWASLLLAEPLLADVLRPGERAALDDARFADLAWSRLSAWLRARAVALRIDPAELPARAEVAIAVHDGGRLVQLVVPRRVDGVRVRDSRLVAVLNHGNLVLLGTTRWAPVTDRRGPSLDAAAARARLRARAPGLVVAAAPELVHLPLAAGADPARSEPGSGLRHRLAWSFDALVAADGDPHRALLDARSGELLALEPVAEPLVPEGRAPELAGAGSATGTRATPLAPQAAVERAVVGGVYPFSNDGREPDGVLESGWPMPYATVTTAGGEATTDAGGNLAGCLDGEISTDLTGTYVAISDTCGAIAESSSEPTLDLGAAASTDCSVPGGGSAGNTDAARTAFYELNRIAEVGRGWLPANSWLQSQLPVVTNYVGTCNAAWVSPNLRAYRSGGGCGNTGELAGVLDAVWGQGLDDNDLNGAIASPSVAGQRTFSALRLGDSCIGRGFLSTVCTGSGDPCDGTAQTGCTGVEDVDWALHACDRPHTVTWITSGFTALECNGTSRPACPVGGGTPCGRSTYCESQVVGETIWDLAYRDLLAAPFNLDGGTARALATKLLHQGTGPVSAWYTCDVGGGCSATGGYLNFLAADDDNGNLSDGTPHMTAIRAAFERHEIHCATPATVDAGCAGGPTTAPIVVATAGDRAATLAWEPVANAASYLVLRSDGLSPCDLGQALVGTTTEASFADGGLANGRPYAYRVIPVGSTSACWGHASTCSEVTPVDDGLDPCDPAIFADDFESGSFTSWSDVLAS